MRNPFERALESVLWKSRFVVILAVVASIAAALVMFWITSVDMHRLELVYFGGAIALVGLALFLSHASESQGEAAQSHRKSGQPPAH
jgi:hypothetical protein